MRTPMNHVFGLKTGLAINPCSNTHAYAQICTFGCTDASEFMNLYVAVRTYVHMYVQLIAHYMYLHMCAYIHTYEHSYMYGCLCWARAYRRSYVCA